MIKKFSNFLNEDGVAFSTLSNTGGMGPVTAPTVGSTPGAVWGDGSGSAGSGDMPAYDRGNRFDFIKKNKKVKSKRKGKHKKLGEDYRNMYVTKFSDWIYPKS